MSDEKKRISPLFDWRQYVASNKGPESPTTRHVLLTLSLYMSVKGDSCFPSIATLAQDTGLGKRTVIKHLKIAHEEGWIEKSRHGYGGQKWKRNEYVAKVPDNISKVVHEMHDVDEKGGASHAEGGASNDEKVVQEMHTNTSGNNSPLLGHDERAGAHEDHDQQETPDFSFLDDRQETYKPDIQDLYDRYDLSRGSPAGLDQLYRNQLGGKRPGPIPKQWIITAVEKHSVPKVCAALHITAMSANNPSTRYCQRVLESWSGNSNSGGTEKTGDIPLTAMKIADATSIALKNDMELEDMFDPYQNGLWQVKSQYEHLIDKEQLKLDRATLSV